MPNDFSSRGSQTASLAGRVLGDDFADLTGQNERARRQRGERRPRQGPVLVDEGTVEVVFETAALEGIVWEVVDAVFQEALSQPFETRALLRTDQVDAEPAMMLMAECTFRIRRDEQEQCVHGIVSELREGAVRSEQFLMADVIVTPAVGLLSRRRDTRVFQDLTVPEILERVLKPDELEAAYPRSLSFELDRRSYPRREYCVQYDETDLAFAHRLMAEEGIFYWFEHGEHNETICLVDHGSRHRFIDRPNGHSIPHTPTLQSGNNHETVRELMRRARVVSTRVSTRHHDWTRGLPFIANVDEGPPDAGEPAHGARSGPVREVYEHDRSPVTFHDYRAEARAYQASDVMEQAKLRRELLARDALVGEGVASVISFRAGRCFELVGHVQPELDAFYVLTEVEHRYCMRSDEDADEREMYTNRFEALPLDVAYRPDRVAERPRVHGLHTAVVVGPSGEDIHTDEHGRIKVQFHWDRLGGNDEHSSCWVRVMQPWAGPGWGSVFLPRIGMEVTVAFLDGDPDRPVVTGTVYDGTRPPPYWLPDQKTRSGIRTKSTPGGGGYNELSFEDLAGHEELSIRAQRDLTTFVGRNETVEVRQDQVRIVRGSQTNLVSRDRTEHIEGSSDRRVEGDALERIDGALAETVHGSSELSVAQDRRVEVGGAEHREVGRTSHFRSADDVTVETAGNHATLVGTDEEKRSLAAYVQGTTHVQSSGLTELVSETGLRLRCGESIVEVMPDQIQLISPKLTLRAPDARLEILGDRVYAYAEDKAEIKSGAVVLKAAEAGIQLKTEAQIDGTKILLNSPTSAQDPITDPEVELTRIELCDEEGAPLPYQRFVLVFEDGSEQTGFLDEAGTAELYLERPAKVRFPGLLDASPA